MPRLSTQGSVLACALRTNKLFFLTNLKKSWSLFFKMFTIVVGLGRVRLNYSCGILDDRQPRV